MKIADYLAGRLFAAGVRYVFGIPGGPSIPYLEAFRSAGITFVLTSNEAAAGIMADVTARLTGVPGVCHATFGPGATNISTGVGGASLDRSPVIVLTSELDDRMIGRTTQMNIDHQKLFAPLTKATFRLSAGNAENVISHALHICLEEYPGPVHIGLPSDIATIEISDPAEVEVKNFKTNPQNDIQGILKLLEKSGRPLIAAGLTAKRHGLSEPLLQFLETYKIPVVVTPMGKGIIPGNHPSYAGVLAHSLSDYLDDIIVRSDLIIGLGYDPVEYDYESWLPDVPLVHFDTRITDLPALNDCIQYTGPPGEWFQMLKNLNEGSLFFEPALIRGIREEMEAVFNGFTDHFGPLCAMKVLQEELPGNTILTVDVGSHLHLAGQYWKTDAGGRLIMTNGWSGMGFGLPAALASALTCRESTTVCITGDGGFLMMAGEMVTARRYNLPVVIVVFSDGELNLIKLKQSWEELNPYGTVLYSGDLFGAGQFLGVKVLKADSEESMRRSVITSLTLNEPVIINAMIDPDDYRWLITKKKRVS